MNAQTDKQRAATAPAATSTVIPRRKASNVRSTKAVRELRATVAQIDALLPALVDKPSKQADLLCEKASAIKILISFDTEERETDQDIRIKELEAGHEADARRISELEQQNRELRVTASTREVVTVTDPNHAAVKEERDSLESIVALLTATMAEDARAEAAVRVSMTCSNPRVVEEFARLTGIDYGALIDYATYTESALRRLEHGKDFRAALVRAFLAVKFPAPAKPQAPAGVFIPDTRSADEKLRDAKASVRQSWTHL